MKLSEFSFSLPEELIARYPKEERTASRLLHLNGANGDVDHLAFPQIESLLAPGDLLVFNNTRVIPARLLGQKETGGKVEVLVERMLENNDVLAHVKASKAPKVGSKLTLDGGIQVEMIGRENDLFRLKFLHDESVLSLLEEYGHMPLPPYIDRPDEESDKERYQTVYNEKPGAVAAPTAGLHFDETILARLKNKGVNLAFVTLHVGAGTFQSVRVDDIQEHKMHAEFADVPADVVEAVRATKKAGKRVIAVGTTSVRSLESAAQLANAEEIIQPFCDDTSIFIYPGYQWRVVDAMLTNFHLPESTLIMLVSAFAGKENILNAYDKAVEEKYRFFSYGDAMFIERGC